MKIWKVLTTILIFLIAGRSFASDYIGDLGTIVVTPSRGEIEAVRWPGSVSVITAREIERSGAKTVDEAVSGALGVNTSNLMGVTGRSTVDVRGMGENAHLRTLVLVDGKRRNRPDMGGINWLEIPVGNIDRIEVARGPAGTMYGSGAVGGVINIVTRRPTEKKNSIDILSEAESFGVFGQRLRVERFEGNWGYSLSAERFRESGYRSRSAASSEGGEISVENRKLPGDIKASLNASFVQSSYEMPGSLSYEEMSEDRRQEGSEEDEAGESHGEISGEVEIPLSGAALLSFKGGYSGRREVWDMPSSWIPSFTDTDIAYLYLAPQLEVNLKTTPLPLRLRAGGDIGKHRLEVDRFLSGEREEKVEGAAIDMPVYGGYIRGELETAENVIVSGGYRRERAKITVSQDSEMADGSRTHSGEALTGGVVYNPSPAVRGYFSFGTHYRYPATDEQASYQGFAGDEFVADLDAEEGFSFETGLSFNPLSFASVDVSFYRMYIKEMIGWDGVLQRNVNMDDTSREGLETGLRMRPAEGISLRLGASAGKTLFEKGDHKGNEMPLVPTSEYSAALSADLMPGFVLRVDASYTGERFKGGDYENKKELLSSYTVVNTAVTISIHQAADIHLGVKNIFNEHYSQAMWGGWYPAPERSFTAAVRAGF